MNYLHVCVLYLIWLYYTIFNLKMYILEHLSDPTRRGHYAAELCPPFSLPWAFHVVVVCCWLSSPVHGSNVSHQFWITSLTRAWRSSARVFSSAHSAERARASWADRVCPSPSGRNKPGGLKHPRHDDKNLPWPKRISLTLCWTLFGSRGWLSMRVVRSWNEGACIFFSLVVQREDKMAARARRACSGCEINPNMFTKDTRFDHSCCLWR